MIVRVRCKCPFCGKVQDVMAEASDLNRWEKGELIQNVWPDWSVDKRELLKTGMCNVCLDKI